MKTRGPYVLLALFFAGLLGLWVADNARIPTRQDRDRAKNRVLVDLIDVRPDDLRKIEIVGGDRPVVLERREGNLWQMTSPVDVAADPSKVETLAFNLKSLTRRPEAATIQGKAEEFGFGPSAKVVRLWGLATDGPIASLDLGKVSLDRRYVRVTGSEGVEVVDAQVLELADLAPVRWRDRELFRVPSFEVDAVKVSGPGRDLELRRKSDGWRIVGPIKALARENRADGLVADLGALRITDDARFVLDDAKPADLDRFGLTTPALTIEVDAGRVDRRRPRQVLHVGKPVEGQAGLVYARQGGQDDVVIIEGRSLAGLGSDINGFRSPKVADIHPARVYRFRVEADGKEFEVGRSGNEWAIIKPELAKADRQAVQSFLKSLDGLQTEIYLTPAGVPDSEVDKPQITLKVWEAGDTRPSADLASVEPDFVLKVGRRDATRKTLYGQTGGDSTVLGLPDSALDFLPRGAVNFRDHLVLALRVERIERLTLSGSGKKLALNAPVLALDPFKTGPIGWWMVEPIVAPADSETMGRLLKLLAGLRAESLVADKVDDLAKFGLKDPPLTLTWSAFASPSTGPAGSAAREIPTPLKLEDFALRIGSQVPGRPSSRYAKLDEGPLVFTISADAVATLGAEFRDHHALSFDPNRVRKVRLDWRDRGVTLSHRPGPSGPTWVIEGPVEPGGLRPELAPALIRAASALMTNRFLQYDGPIPPPTGLEPAVLTIRFEFDDATAPKVLKVGHPSAKAEVFASTAAGPTGPIFLAPDAPFGDWIKPPRQAGDLPDNVFVPDRP